MTAEQKENLRLQALKAIGAAKGYAVTLSQILPGLAHPLRTQPTEDIEAELLYLKDKGFVESEKKEIGTVKRWRITAAGRDYLAEEGME